MLNRRKFLKDMAGATAGICFVSCGLTGAAATSQSSDVAGRRREVLIAGRRVLTVDLHAHCSVPDILDLIEDHDESRAMRAQLETPLGRHLDLLDVDYRLKQMDEQGVDIQAISISPFQFHYWAERDLARQMVQIQNEKIAAFCATHPNRLVGLGTAALQHPDLAVEQMEYAVKKLDLRGFEIGGSVNGEELSAPKFNVFWAKAEELGALIFIHPSGFPDGARRFQGNGYLSNLIGNPLDTTVALSHLMFEGTLDRYPRLKICAAHGGGFLASYIGRSDHCVEKDPRRCRPVKKRPSEYLKQLYFDAIVYTAEGLRHLVAEVGADQIVLGTDYPFGMGDPEAVNHILSSPWVTDAQREAMLGRTAAKLLRIGS